MKQLWTHKTAKTLSFATFGITMLHAASSYAAVSQSPLSATVGVSPNLILTLDDSGSMRASYTPDAINSDRDSRRTRSSTYNSMYYSPSATYEIPKKYNSSGVESGSYTTSFTAAYYNGYNTALGSTNLSTKYAASWWYSPQITHSANFTDNDPNYANRQYANNPAADFRTTVTLSLSGTGSTTITLAGLPVTVQRLTSNTAPSVYCKATYNSQTASCSRTSSGNQYTVDLSQVFVPAYYYVFKSGLAGCTGATEELKKSNDACYELKYVSSTSGEIRDGSSDGLDERKNFATWYSFYRNRALATSSSARLAFSELSSNIRFTWQSLNSCQSLNGTAAGCGSDNRFREYQPAQRGRFFSWLDTVPFNSGTPLREALGRAGEFLKTDTPWHKYPNESGNTSANTYACRPSYHVLMTDGIWNGNNGSPGTPFNHDGSSFTLPDGVAYSSAKAPYGDATANTLADLAMHYWATDLRSGLNNKLTPYIPFKSGNDTTDYWDARNDPAKWQHMVNFTMGLGLTRSLTSTGIQWQGSTFASAADGNGFKNLQNGTAWPPAATDSGNNVYDLWHAAINSRGEFFSVDSPDAMVTAFSDILSRIADRKASAAKPAINSSQISEDEVDNGIVKTISYQTSYASDENWSGDVKRFEKTWNATTETHEVSEIWSAKQNIPAWSSRNIKIPATSGNKLQPFVTANAGLSGTVGTLAYYLNQDPTTGSVDGKWQQRLDYLRGNRTGEGSTFRERSSLLGDFYSSSPAVVSKHRYLQSVANRLEGNTAYTSFVASVQNRSPRVYVGGNAGMLHGFNAKTGAEEFAFIPTAVFSKLNKLAGTNYSHEFYVEGSPVVSDVYDGSQWRTILVGTLKGGGKAIFALDVTVPGDEKLLWEFDDSKIPAANLVKMGYSFAQPTIARLHTGKWAVVIGNGYESAGSDTTGRAALFVIDAISGNLLTSLEVAGTPAIANGLSTPKLGDFNADGVADYAYAGDLQGNLWRFDLLRNGRSTSNPFTTSDDGSSAKDAFRVSFGGSPLFKAVANNGVTSQPITSAPSLVRHPKGVGYLAIFGTGKFYETGDKDGNKAIAQTVYGVWDRNTLGQNSGNPSISRGSLQSQSFSETSASDGTTTVTARTLSNNEVEWLDQAGNVKRYGWYLNLNQSEGEMIVENMNQLGRTLVFQSLVPNDDPCSDGTSNWTYAIDPFTGGQTTHQVFNYTPTDSSNKNNISVVKQPGEGGITVSQNPDKSFEACTGESCITIYPDPASRGRQTWRKVEIEE